MHIEIPTNGFQIDNFQTILSPTYDVFRQKKRDNNSSSDRKKMGYLFLILIR